MVSFLYGQSEAPRSWKRGEFGVSWGNQENSMGVNRFGFAFLASAIAFGVMGTVAKAADIPVVKAPPPSPWVLDVHGFVDFDTANSRVTGGGLLLYPTSSTLVHATIGVSLDIYKNTSGFINSFSVFGGVWNEVLTDPGGLQAAAGFRHWQEMDWWAGVKIGFAQHWTLTAQHLEFAFPITLPTSYGATTRFQLPTAVNDVFTLSF